MFYFSVKMRKHAKSIICDEINQALQNFMPAIIGKSNLQGLRFSSLLKLISLLQNIHLYMILSVDRFI